LNRKKNPFQVIFSLATGFSLLGALVSYFFLPALLPLLLIVTLLCFAVALLFTFLLQRRGNPERSRTELQEIRSAFKKRFGIPLSTAADFSLLKSRLDREMGKAQGAEEKQIRAQKTLENLKERIGQLLQMSQRIGVSQTEWERLAKELKDRTRQLRIDYNLATQQLSDLGIDEVDYLEQAVSERYTRRQEEQINGELAQLEQTIRHQQDSSRELREQLIEHIGMQKAHSQSIELLAMAIEETKQKYRQQIREALALMIAAHVLDDVLAAFRRQEDEQLKSTLNDPRITELIQTFTAGRYEAVSMAEGGLYIENEAESFPLETMSSGAREQVLMALRMGLASVVCGKQSLFLILDDAFQYSDWQRREHLVRRAVQIVRSGWQVIYLTMDDDIRDRFRRAAQILEQGTFQLLEL
jgi:uncharacterized protein YhaN